MKNLEMLRTAMMVRVYNLGLLKLGLFGLFFIMAILSQTSSVSALGNTFTNNGNGGSGVYAMVSRAGPNVTLDATEARFKIFRLGSGSTNVTIIGACDRSSYDDVDNKDITVTIDGITKSNTGADCSGNDLVFSNVNVNGSAAAYGNYRHKTVFVNKSPASGIKSFRVQVSTGYVTFDELSQSQTYTAANQPAKSAFSVWNAQKGVGPRVEGSFIFKFKPNRCNYNGTSTVHLKWQDADVGESNEQGALSWRLIKVSNGSTVATASGLAALGGNDSNKFAPVGVLDLNEEYEWRWDNVDKNNGIQIFMPFSEISQLGDACPIPAVSVTASCSSSTQASISGNIEPRTVPRNTWTYKIFLNPPNSSLPSANTDSSGNFSDNATGDFSSDTTGFVRVYSNAAGGPVERSDAGFTIARCGAGGGGGLNRNCRVFELNLTRGSEYRFTIFNTRAVQHTSTPSEGQFAASGAEWVWKNFDTIPIDQRRIARGSSAPPVTFTYDFNTGATNGTSTGFTNTYGNPSLDWIVYIEKWQRNPGGGWNYSDGNASPSDIGRSPEVNCFVADCDISISGGNIPGKPTGFASGSPITVNGQINNRGNDVLDENFSGFRLSLTEPPGTPHYVGRAVAVGGTASVTFTRTAEAGRGTYTVTMYPDYYGRRAVGPACSATYEVYERYQVDMFAELMTIDTEDPRAIVWRAGGNSNVPVTLNWTRGLTKEPPRSDIDGPYNSDNTFSYTETRTFNGGGTPLVPGTLKAGDTVCAWAQMNDPAYGWVGPGGIVGDPNQPNDAPVTDCEVIHDAPYMHVFGDDVFAGSAFAVGGICSPSTASIKTYRSSQADRAGSGSQLAGIASGSIENFITASMKPAIRPLGLAIGSAGGYSGEAACSTDYFGETRFPDDSDKLNTSGAGTLNPSSLNAALDGEQTIYNGNLTITAGTVGVRHTVFVNGNVIINGNIELGGFTDPLDAPAFGVIASGNIYIDNDVERMDGLYVAQPGTGGGTIFTCANGTSPFSTGSAAAMIANCSNTQLTVNGIFVADRVQLLRTRYSLRDSIPGEHSNLPCPQPSRPGGNLNSCAAEIFNMPQEIYLSPPPLYSPPPSLKYQYYETLPPLL